MKKALLVFLSAFSIFLPTVAQGTEEMTEDALRMLVQKGMDLYEEGNYARSYQLLKEVAETGALDKGSMGMLAFYLCDCCYGIAKGMEDGTVEKYETMKECHRWMLQVDWRHSAKGFDAAGFRRNVITSYVTSIHHYATTFDDPNATIALELEAKSLYEPISKKDMNMGVIKATLHELYISTKQWDEAIAMGHDAEKIVFDNDGLISDVMRLNCNLAMIFNHKGDYMHSSSCAMRVVSCVKDRDEEDLSHDERILYSKALYFLGIAYQQLANPTYYAYFKQAYYLIKSNDAERQERYFRELLLQLVTSSRAFSDQEYTAKFLDELMPLCKEYENPLGRFYNEVWAIYLEECTNSPDMHDQALGMLNDFIAGGNEWVYYTEVCDFEEWPPEKRMGIIMHAMSSFVYGYAEELLGMPEQIEQAENSIKSLNEISKELSLTEISKEACRMLSYLAYIQKDYATCIAYGHQSLTNDVLNLDGDLFALQLMASSARYLQRYDAVEVYNNNLFLKDKILLNRNFGNLTSEVRANYWMGAEYNFVATISNAVVCNTKESRQLAYDASLCRKGVLLAADQNLARVVAESHDTCLQRMYADLQEIRASRTALAMEGKERLARYLAIEGDKLEAEVIHLAKNHNDMRDIFEVSWKDINRQLSKREAAIEFEQYRDDENEMHYVALVLAKGQIHQVELFSSQELGTLLASGVYSTRNLANRLWSPILQIIPDAQTIYFAPCGQLYNVAIESLCDEDGFISDYRSLVRLSSTRELLPSQKRKSGSAATLYGGLQYDMDIEELALAERPYSTQRGSLSLIAPLPGTLDEVNAIAKTLRQAKIGTEVLSDVQGTEGSFKALSGKSLRIVHIATHGFYSTVEDTRSSSSEFSPLGCGISEEDYALTRSGLLFAGADNKLLGEDIPMGIDDGVLTAGEISTMDLRGLDLVTLSACETAKGDITGDGVFGLQRGFKKAGANSILMSLWKVDDEATCKLMTEFYSNWISKKMTKHDALEAAKKTVRETKGWEDPKYWAAFILLDGLD